MEWRFTRCGREATNTEYVLCEEHAAHHEKCLEWGRLHIEGKATTKRAKGASAFRRGEDFNEDHPDYCPIVVDVN